MSLLQPVVRKSVMNRKQELFLVVFVIVTGFAMHYLISSLLNLPDDTALLRGSYLGPIGPKVDL